MQKAAPTRQAVPQSAPRSSSGSSTQQFSRNSWFQLQSNVGNQAMTQLLQAGIIQAKLRVSQPGDPDEAEADRAAERVVSATRAPIIQRKCACGGTCSKCSDEEEQRRAPRLQLSSLSSRVQRAAKEGGAAQPDLQLREDAHRGPVPGLIVEDGAPVSSPGQMKKSAFFALLESDICATADAELAAVGRSTKSCPYIEKWLAFYRDQSAVHLERALLRYAPEAAEATTARDYIRDVRQRVRRAVSIWARTGRITGVPPGIGLMPTGALGEEKKEEGFGTGLLRAVAGVGKPQFKEKGGSSPPPTDAESVRSQLGRGRALDSPVRSRMESAFGRDFSSVRIHHDGAAGNLSSHLNARAFTIGNDVAFGSGEYKPGTLVGDALIAHELAHVVQQGAAAQSNAPMLKGDSDYNALEADADVSAVGAVASLWAGANGRLSDIGRNAAPRLQSGLKLQRCNQEVELECPKGYSWRVQRTTGWGSFGCTCHWKCLPGEDPRRIAYTPQDTVRCPENVWCDTGKKKEELSSDYEKTGGGASMTPPPPADAYCGCFPLTKEGKQVSNTPMLLTEFEMTDIAAPLADIAAARSARPKVDPTTGRVLPEQKSTVVEPAEVKPPVVIEGPLPVAGKAGDASKAAAEKTAAEKGQAAQTATPVPETPKVQQETPKVEPHAPPPVEQKPADKPAPPPTQKTSTQPVAPTGPKTLDDRIREAEAQLGEKRQAVVEYKAEREAAGEKQKGGPYKGLWNVKEEIWVLKRQKAFPNRQILKQGYIKGVRGSDGKIRTTEEIAGTGRILDYAEIEGGKVVGGDLKSAAELVGSIEGGVKSPKEIEGKFRPKSKIGGQQTVEGKVLDVARSTGGKLVITGTDVRTEKEVTIEIDASKYQSNVVSYESVYPD